jgi:hypothetical protein
MYTIIKNIIKPKTFRAFGTGFLIAGCSFLLIFMNACNNRDNDTVILSSFDTNVNYSSKVVNSYDFAGEYHMKD